MKKKYCMVAALSVLSLFTINARVRLSPLFTDNMVLQQESTVPIWGKSEAGKTVKVTTSWDGKKYSAKSDANGKWRVDAITQKAGGPYVITINDGDETKLSNVMIGEVWLCSGQSNMEMSVKESRFYSQEREDADNHPNIRLLGVVKNTATQPLDEFAADGGGWQVCSSATISDFSAAGYFFGREIEKYRDVPVGLIDSSWGGTSIEVWTSAGSLSQVPSLKEQVAELSKVPATSAERQKKYDEDLAKWEELLQAKDKGYNDRKPIWAQADFSDERWSEVNMPCMVQDTDALRYFNGIMWLRKTVTIPEEWAGKDVVLNLGNIDDNDVTFFNGEIIGHTENWMLPRRYTVPKELVKSGKAVITVRMTDTGGKGGMGGSAQDMRLECGSAKIDVSGDWKYCVSLDLRDIPAMPVNTSFWPMPTFLYNAMINPLLPYTIKGAIWYQGEANVNQARLYGDLLPLMIQDWRKCMGKDLSFYVVQLANFMERQEQPSESSWAELRESQTKALNLENTGMAVIIDIGEANDIHPKNKQEVGRRLSLAARAITYVEKIEYSGPMYSGYKIEGSTIRVIFDHADSGLKVADYAAIESGKPVANDELQGFAIAGADRKFHWAKARIEGNSIVVWSDDVPMPLAVRYAWADNPEANLYNGENLPASPFRTDDWEGITK